MTCYPSLFERCPHPYHLGKWQHKLKVSWHKIMQVQTASDQLTLNQPNIDFMLFWNSVTALDLQSCVNSITPFYSHKNKWPKQLHLMIYSSIKQNIHYLNDSVISQKFSCLLSGLRNIKCVFVWTLYIMHQSKDI